MPNKSPQLELSIDHLVLEGVPAQPGLAAEVEAELLRLLHSPAGAAVLAALHSGPPRRELRQLAGGTIDLPPGGQRAGTSLGRAIYKTLGGLGSPGHPKEGRS